MNNIEIELNEKINNMVEKVFESNINYVKYLEAAGRLCNLNVDNILLTMIQNDKAMWIETKENWNKYGRTIIEGALGIINVRMGMSMRRVDNKTEVIKMYQPVKVYDLSETAGKEIFKKTVADGKIVQSALESYFNYLNEGNSSIEFMSIKYATMSSFKVLIKHNDIPDITNLCKQISYNEKYDFLDTMQKKISDTVKAIEIIIEKNKKKSLYNIKEDVNLYKENKFDITKNTNSKKNERNR